MKLLIHLINIYNYSKDEIMIDVVLKALKQISKFELIKKKNQTLGSISISYRTNKAISSLIKGNFDSILGISVLSSSRNF